MTVKPPDRIYLQLDDDGVPETFCVDKVNDLDVMYIRLHAFKDAMRNEIARLLDELNDPAYQLPEAETDE